MPKNRQILLKRRPSGMPTLDDFQLVEKERPEPGLGQVLVRNQLLSLDPYMRGRMDDGKSYMAPVELGQVMTAHTVGEVVTSNDPAFDPGEKVFLTGGWQDYAIAQAPDVRKINPALPDAAWLGPMGLPGWTAHYGLFELGHPATGETLVVSSAAGAVGSLVGQLAKAQGLRVVGIAGGPEKCAYVVNELGFDACVDYKVSEFAARLADACPNGIDIDFENVGGDVLNAIWTLLNASARIVVCGLSAHYNLTKPLPGPDLTKVLKQRVNMRGFIISDHRLHIPKAIGEMATLVGQGKLTTRNDITTGLEYAPNAFIGMLQGKNFGKTLVQVA